MLTGPEAGITRDAIAIDWQWRGRKIRLFDTAGHAPPRHGRPRSSSSSSVGDTLRAIRFAEIVRPGASMRRSRWRSRTSPSPALVAEEGRAVVLAVNKWDLVADKSETLTDLRDTLETSLPQLAGIGAVTLSAQSGAGVDKLMPAVLEAYEVWNRRVPTPQLNRWLEEAQERNPPPLVAGRRLQAALHDPGQYPAADLRALRLEARRAARQLSPLSHQPAARELRPPRRADPHDAAQGQEPVRRGEAIEEALDMMGPFGIGQSVSRFEDPRLLRGGGRYINDVNLPGQAYA